jgi:hypothetical protein
MSLNIQLNMMLPAAFPPKAVQLLLQRQRQAPRLTHITLTGTSSGELQHVKAQICAFELNRKQPCCLYVH